MTEHKQFSGIELKAGAEGKFRAVFSTLNTVDRDSDYTAKGAFTEGAKVKIAAFGHDYSSLPIGVGTIHTEGEKAYVDGELFLNTTGGRDTYEALKGLGALCSWSYGFRVKDHDFMEHEGKRVRRLKSLEVVECSPVMIPAGVGTMTTSIKSATDDADRDLFDFLALEAEAFS